MASASTGQEPPTKITTGGAMAEQDKTYDEKADEVQSAPTEGAGWERESDSDDAETERAEK